MKQQKYIVIITLVSLFSIFLESGCVNEEITDTIAPIITILEPTDSTVVSGIFLISSVAEDNLGVAKVEYFINNILQNTVNLNKPPYWYQINSRQFIDSTWYVLSAQAYDNSGNISIADTSYILVDNSNIPPLGIANFNTGTITKHSVTLSWVATVDYKFESYQLMRSYRDTNLFPEEPIAIINDPDVSSYIDFGIGESDLGLINLSTYYYYICSTNNDSLSTCNTSISVETKGPEKIYWKGNGIKSKSKHSLELEWLALNDDDVADILLYQLEKSTESGDTSLIDISPDSVFNFTFIDTGLISESVYSYRIRHCDSLGFYSDFSPQITDSTLSLEYDIMINSDIHKYSADILFNSYPEDDFYSYEFYLCEEHLDSLPEEFLYYELSLEHYLSDINFINLIQNTDYTIFIKLTDIFGNSLVKNHHITTLTLLSPKITADEIGKYSILLKFSKYIPENDDFNQHIIYRGNESNFDLSNYNKKWEISDINQISFLDENILPNTNYVYKITLEDTSGASAVSNEISVLSLSVAGVSITNFHKNQSPLYNYIEWEWIDGADSDFSYFELYRSYTTDLSFDYQDEKLIYSSNSEMNYSDSDIDPNYFYSYYVRVVDTYGSYTNSLYINHFGVDAPPEIDLFVNSVSNTSITLGWSLPMKEGILIDNFYNYHILRFNLPDSLPDEYPTTVEPFSFIQSISNINTQSYEDTGLGEGNIYYYRIYVENLVGIKTASNEIQAASLP